MAIPVSRDCFSESRRSAQEVESLILHVNEFMFFCLSLFYPKLKASVAISWRKMKANFKFQVSKLVRGGLDEW